MLGEDNQPRLKQLSEKKKLMREGATFPSEGNGTPARW